jgi:DNA-directed RNA polymerase specialized sigma24 family protein
MSSLPPAGDAPTLPEDDRLSSLLDEMGGGDLDAFRSLLQCAGPWLYPVARRLVSGDSVAAAALYQQLFLEIWRISPCYDRNLGPPMAWMLLLLREEAGIADRACADAVPLEQDSLERLWFGDTGGSDGD